LTDHFPIIFRAKNHLGGGGNKFFEARNFSKQNLEAFNQILARADWNSVLTSEATQEAYSNATHFPVQCHKFNRNYHKLEKWMTSGVLTSAVKKFAWQNLVFRIHP
jgi:hypothetical protein